jgi:hypothetical protein
MSVKYIINSARGHPLPVGHGSDKVGCGERDENCPAAEPAPSRHFSAESEAIPILLAVSIFK